MGKWDNRALADLTGTGQNAGVSVEDFESSAVWVVGTFAGTVQVQVSPDGTNWVNQGSPTTVPARVALPTDAKLVRFDCTAYTSGTISGVATGRDDDRLG